MSNISDISRVLLTRHNNTVENLCKDLLPSLLTPKRTDAGTWARKNRVITDSYPSDEKGPFRPEKDPYTLEIYRAIADIRFETVVICCGAQMSKTEILLNVVAENFDTDPRPVIYAMPTKDLVKMMVRNRLDSLIKSTPSLREGMAKQDDNMFSKIINGSYLLLGWAGSVSQLCSNPAWLVILDERDRMDATKEGDPFQLLKARTTTFPDAKSILTSTPTTVSQCKTWNEFKLGTQREWTWQCPKCRNGFKPCLERLKFDMKIGVANPLLAASKAYIECPTCQYRITDNDKTSINTNGRYLSPGQKWSKDTIYGEIPKSKIASFWVSGLASRHKTIIDRAYSLINAYNSKDISKIMAVINTDFGELFDDRGSAPEVEEVRLHCGNYLLGAVPEATVHSVIATVDVQKSALVYTIRSWKPIERSWLVYYGILDGDTSDKRVWSLLEIDVITGEWSDPSGVKLSPRLILIDSAFRPEHVYRLAAKYRGQVFPARGNDSKSLAVPYRVNDLDSKLSTEQLKIVHLNDSYWKSWVHSKIKDSGNTGKGAWFLPSEVSDDYCSQLLNERLVTTPAGRTTWRSFGVHDFLDCEKMQGVGASILKINDRNEKGEVELQRKKQPETPARREKAVYSAIGNVYGGPPAGVNPYSGSGGIW